MMMNHRYEGSTATHPKALSEWDGLDPSRSPCGANNEAEWDKMWIRLKSQRYHSANLPFSLALSKESRLLQQKVPYFNVLRQHHVVFYGFAIK